MHEGETEDVSFKHSIHTPAQRPAPNLGLLQNLIREFHIGHVSIFLKAFADLECLNAVELPVYLPRQSILQGTTVQAKNPLCVCERHLHL